MGVRIHRKSENPMQQGRGNGRTWVLEFDNPTHVRADPLTGWSGSGETQGQVSINFPSREAAIEFAERQNLAYQVIETPPREPRAKTYAANFTAGPAVEL